MKILLSRSSVCAGDDFDPPHHKEIKASDKAKIEEILSKIIKSNYLPSIDGGEATWSVSSNKLLAVVAEQWEKPKMLDYFPPELEELDFTNNQLKIHFSYHAQQDPNVVFEVLERAEK